LPLIKKVFQFQRKFWQFIKIWRHLSQWQTRSSPLFFQRVQINVFTSDSKQVSEINLSFKNIYFFALSVQIAFQR
jgi:hypothetical protein